MKSIARCKRRHFFLSKTPHGCQTPQGSHFNWVTWITKTNRLEPLISLLLGMVYPGKENGNGFLICFLFLDWYSFAY